MSLRDVLTGLTGGLSDNPGLDAEPDRERVDVIATAIACERRRHTIQVLDDIHYDASLSLGDLAERVAARENQKPISELTCDERKRVYVALYQTHIDTLEDAGALIRERDNIIPGPTVDALSRLITDIHAVSADHPTIEPPTTTTTTDQGGIQ